MYHEWVSEEIFIEGDQFLDAIINDIRNAKESINLEFYIFEYEKIGFDLLKELEKSAKKGVSIRLIIDGVGSFFSIDKIEKFCVSSGIQYKIFNKIPFSFRLLSLFNIWSHVNFVKKFSILNRRTHRKMIIIDNEIAYIGSRNISDVHFMRYSKTTPWLDLSVKVAGVGVQKLNRSFERVWRKPIGILHSTKHRFKYNLKFLQTLRNYPVRLNYTLAMRIFFWWETNRLIRTASHRVWIMNAYFVPHKTILNALKYAANRGVDVRLCLPAKTDVPVVRWATLIFYKILLQDRMRVFEYDKSVLHTKMMIIDKHAIVGSHNLNHRSILHDLECEVVLNKPSTLEQIETFWESTINSSHEISISNKLNLWSGLNWFDKIKGRLALLFRYYI